MSQSLKFFSAEFSVGFSFSCLTWKNFSSRLLFDFTFISWEASACLKYVSAIQEASDETFLVAQVFRAFNLVPEFVLRISIVVLDKKWR